MKTFLLAVVTLFSLQSLGQKEISIDSVKAHLGEYISVCGKVYGVKELDKIAFINLGAAYPNAPLTLVVFAGDKKKFKKALAAYDGKDICVKGNITLYQGKTYQLRLETEEQITEKKVVDLDLD